jgi:hypothetical protein
MNRSPALLTADPSDSLSLSNVLDLPTELAGNMPPSFAADAGTPLAVDGATAAKTLYRYRDTREGHEHFEVQD